MSKPTPKDMREHLMNHVQALTQLEHQLLGIKRQVLTSYHALGEMFPETEELPATNRLHVSRERLRELIKNEGDLPVEVGTPFSPHMGPGRVAAPFSPPMAAARTIDGTATYEGDEWRFEEGGIVGDPEATLIVYKGNKGE